MKINSFLPVLLATTSITLVAQAIPAQAFELGFTRKTNNSSFNVAPQLTTSVDDLGSGQVKFTFNNSGSVSAGTITEVDFGKTNFLNLLSLSSLSTTAAHNLDQGVNFTQTNTATLPATFGWNPAITFKATNSGYQKTGVDVGESLSIIFNLKSGTSFSDIETGFKNGTLAIATHVQSIGGTGGVSDKFESTYNTNNTKSVPEPGTILGLMAFGMGGLLTRKKSKNANSEKVTL
ncbi:PEP-CTERM sorting domain-containing protein [Calothrix sp. NIES-2098]|uniref:PEP-CTERM sorting domain-containing protein n=1 Tax=Calothrix sp. NIES-2098 TaxID=1954171 RepID=UPI000B60CA58|nr:hypothetical protein NIES2098_38790 [Calothrix sp. NIES-2098]